LRKEVASPDGNRCHDAKKSRGWAKGIKKEEKTLHQKRETKKIETLQVSETGAKGPNTTRVGNQEPVQALEKKRNRGQTGPQRRIASGLPEIQKMQRWQSNWIRQGKKKNRPKTAGEGNQRK